MSKRIVTRARIGAVIAALFAVASTGGSQELTGGFTPEIRPFVGVYVPTGAMQDQFESASMAGLQIAVELNRNFHVLGSVGWTHGHTKLSMARDRTDIWQYDIGVEGNLIHPLNDLWLLRPFAGIAGFSNGSSDTNGLLGFGVGFKHPIVSRLSSRFEANLAHQFGDNDYTELGLLAGLSFFTR